MPTHLAPTRHRATAAALAALLALLALAGPALAASSVSPGQATMGEPTTFTVRVVDADGVDLVSRVSASLPTSFVFDGCGAPSGWACDGSNGLVEWSRQSSLAPDDTFTFTVTPQEPGQVAVTVTDTRTSGASSSSTATVDVAGAPEPEPTEDPTATDEPSEVEDEPTPEPEPDRPAPPLEPFRPPAEDGPISINDLPDEPAPTETSIEAVVEPARKPSRGLGVFVLAPLAVLLLLSAAGFVLAETNR